MHIWVNQAVQIKLSDWRLQCLTLTRCLCWSILIILLIVIAQLRFDKLLFKNLYLFCNEFYRFLQSKTQQTLPSLWQKFLLRASTKLYHLVPSWGQRSANHVPQIILSYVMDSVTIDVDHGTRLTQETCWYFVAQTKTVAMKIWAPD